MSSFKIHFQLKELDKICPFGGKPTQSLSWFGLTDGLLWIEAGEHVIYEYTKEAQKYFGNPIRYNDYYLSRFLEDFSDTFRYVSELIPEELFKAVEVFRIKAKQWKDSHMDDDDDTFIQFYDNDYSKLVEWHADRSFDSGHLVGGPYIGCFRCEGRIKILWESSYKLESGNSIWTFPRGCVEIAYDEFVLSVLEFFDEFFDTMDKQVEKAISKDWGDIELDKERLIQENAERKEIFYKEASSLKKSLVKTDWAGVMDCYAKMKSCIELS